MNFMQNYKIWLRIDSSSTLFLIHLILHGIRLQLGDF